MGERRFATFIIVAIIMIVAVVVGGVGYFLITRQPSGGEPGAGPGGDNQGWWPGAPIHVPDGYVASNVFSSALVAPWDLAFGPDGDLYVAEFTGSRVSKMASDGSVSTYVKIPEPFRGTVRSLVFSSSGDLYVLVSSGGLEGEFDGILKISTDQTTSVLSGVGGIEQLAIGPSGDIFAAGGSEIIRITPDGVLTTFASGLSLPHDLEFGASGDLFVLESGSGEISKITPDGTRTVFASGFPDFSVELRFFAFDVQGNILVNDVGRFYRVTPSGTVTVIEYFPDQVPGCFRDMIFDSSGNLYVADGTASRILKIFPDYTASVLVDGFMSTGLAVSPSGDIFAIDTAFIRGDPPSTDILKVSLNGTSTTFATVSGIASEIDFNAAGELYVAVFDGDRILKIDSNGEVSTFVTGLHNPSRLTFGQSGDLFVLESYNRNVLRITPEGEISTLATGFGDVTTGSLYGSLAADFMGNVFLGSRDNNTVYKIFPDGTATTFATGISDTGFWDYGDLTVSPSGEIFATDSIGKLYRITENEVTLFATGLTIDPRSITCSSSGELFIARAGNIVKISAE